MKFEIEIGCPFCGEISVVEVYAEDYNAYLCGKHAQDAFPYLSATEREMLISGLCVDCQAKIFGE